MIIKIIKKQCNIIRRVLKEEATNISNNIHDRKDKSVAINMAQYFPNTCPYDEDKYDRETQREINLLKNIQDTLGRLK